MLLSRWPAGNWSMRNMPWSASTHAGRNWEREAVRNDEDGSRATSATRVKLVAEVARLPIFAELRQDRVDDVAVDVRQAAVDAVVADRQLFVVDAQQVQQRGVQVVDG